MANEIVTPISRLCDACHKHFGMDCEPIKCEMAKVVKQLQAERDAAVDGLETIAKKLDDPCYWCANYPDVKLTCCMMCDDEEYNGNFEWRGLSLEKNDKEEKE